MDKQALTELIEYLEEQAIFIRELEQEGEVVLAQEGQHAFQVQLEKKAELLAALGEKSWGRVQRVGGELAENIAQRLEQFSMSASSALRIGSVFFMTALLYPEDHAPGMPNDLEVLIEQLKTHLK